MIQVFISKVIDRMSSRKRFVATRILMILYTILWCWALYWVNFVWESQMIFRVGISFLLALFTPEIQDLFVSYNSYIKESNEKNDKIQSSIGP